MSYHLCSPLVQSIYFYIVEFYFFQIRVGKIKKVDFFWTGIFSTLTPVFEFGYSDVQPKNSILHVHNFMK